MSEQPEISNQQPQEYAFFVYVVESPSPTDIYHGRSEGGIVANALKLDGIPCVTRTTINPDAFLAALRVGLPEAMNAFPGRYPILHLSAHGGFDGIQLSTGTVVTWKDLRDLLVPINESLQGTLLLCMSACEGYSACRMAMEVGDFPHPYFAVVGNFGKPTWSDTAVSYLAFYHLLAKGWSIPEAAKSMRAASGNYEWAFQTAEETKEGYLKFLTSQFKPEQAQRELEEVAQEENIPATAKALEESHSH